MLSGQHQSFVPDKAWGRLLRLQQCVPHPEYMLPKASCLKLHSDGSVRVALERQSSRDNSVSQDERKAKQDSHLPNQGKHAVDAEGLHVPVTLKKT